MIPRFEPDGNLPKGVHQATLGELRARFGVGSARRKWLMKRLEEIVELVKSTGRLERVVVWGSFVTSKSFPGDVDLLLVMDRDFTVDGLDPETATVFDYTQARIAFDSDIFWAKSSIGEETLSLWLETYQQTRDFKPCGIVEVTIE